MKYEIIRKVIGSIPEKYEANRIFVYIGFFDGNAVENICGCPACVPDKVIPVGLYGGAMDNTFRR